MLLRYLFLDTVTHYMYCLSLTSNSIFVAYDHLMIEWQTDHAFGNLTYGPLVCLIWKIKIKYNLMSVCACVCSRLKNEDNDQQMHVFLCMYNLKIEKYWRLTCEYCYFTFIFDTRTPLVQTKRKRHYKDDQPCMHTFQILTL